jgi:polar amino acid transport system substrate-binding protein
VSRHRYAPLVLCLLLISCQPSLPPVTHILPTPALRIGIDPGNPPFAFHTETGFDGFEISLGTAIAERLGVPVAWVSLGYDGLYDALAADRADVVIAALPIDPTRAGSVRYATAYFNAGLVLVTLSPDIARMDDLVSRRLAFEYGSIAHATALEWTRRIAPFTLLPQPSAHDALHAAQTGTADAALTDTVSARIACRQYNPCLDSHPVSDILLAPAVRIDRPALADHIDRAVQMLLGEGIIEDLIEVWIG